jgi:superfamily I DNA/RNA helicase
LQRAGLLDFDSILHYGVKILKKLGGEGMNWTHLLVDEVQDSSDMDFEIFQLLPMEWKMYCGDLDQAIFQFRGGRPENILKLAAQADSASGISGGASPQWGEDVRVYAGTEKKKLREKAVL